MDFEPRYSPEQEDFRREVRHTARLDHPNIVPIKTAGDVDGHFVIVQPLAQETLATRLTRRVALRTALTWSEQLLDALAHAHRRRLIHCDVKPENVLLFSEGKVRLADFGISKVAQRTLSGLSPEPWGSFLTPGLKPTSHRCGPDSARRANA